jgi:hypothetical protein
MARRLIGINWAAAAILRVVHCYGEGYKRTETKQLTYERDESK